MVYDRFKRGKESSEMGLRKHLGFSFNNKLSNIHVVYSQSKLDSLVLWVCMYVCVDYGIQQQNWKQFQNTMI